MVRELKRTPYRPRMAVLGSREHYCIHPEVSHSRTKDQDCDALIKESRGAQQEGRSRGCGYFR